MSTPDLGPILEDLAAGRIDASEAARRIDALKATAAPESPETKPAEPTNEELAAEELGDSPRRQYSPHARDVFAQPEGSPDAPTGRRRPTGSKGVDRISVRAVGRRVRIVGDPSVATASAEGPHVLRRNGAVLEITSDGELGPSLDGFSILRPPRSLDDIRALGLGKELLLRINPSIIVDVEVTAGHLTCNDVPYLGKVRVTAGGADLTGVAEAHDVLVQAGSATLKGAITTGRSRVRVESGQLSVDLDDHSNVTVRGEAQLGKVSWSGAHTGQVDEVVLGNGSARLDVGVVMGWANIKAGNEVAQ
ncbi:MAG TPA: hypothetical protein PLL50_05675 [Propionicimonas sp.]|nr:hypothetical protein [Propionicimonas sp.]HQD96779.1 hypothetical protein [Propionicimonas sp.]